MGLFNRKKKEKGPVDLVNVLCTCDKGIAQLPVYETVANPEPRPQFYGWMNNPQSEEYSLGGDRIAKEFREYEPSKTVLTGYVSDTCPTCNGSCVRQVERSVAVAQGLQILPETPIQEQGGVTERKFTEQKSERQTESNLPKSAPILVNSPNLAEINAFKEEGERIMKAILKTNLENYDSVSAEMKKSVSALDTKIALLSPKLTEQEIKQLTSFMAGVDFTFIMWADYLGKK